MYTKEITKMNEKDHMIRLKKEVYLKLTQKRLDLMKKYRVNYTLSETVEICILEANMYEEEYYK